MTDNTEVGTNFDADFRIRFQRRFLTVCHRHYVMIQTILGYWAEL